MSIANFSSFLLSGTDTIYHYTTQEGLLGILRDNCLWATSIRHLNDATEFSYASDLATAELEGRLQIEPQDAFYRGCLKMLIDYQDTMAFVVSLSADTGDRLSQWRAYSGPGVGYSIGFDVQKLVNIAQEQRFNLKPCTYDRVQHVRGLEELIIRAKNNELTAGSASDEGKFIVKFLEAAVVMKDPHFNEEHEWRLSRTESLWPDTTKFRSGKSMLVPYIKFNLKNRDAIVEVVVGPSPQKDLCASSLHPLRLAYGGDFQVRKSAIPFRNW